MKESALLLIHWILLAVTATALQPPKEEPPYIEIPPKSGTQMVYIRRVVDGDTIQFFFLIPCDRGRLDGINAPEMRKPGGGENPEGVMSRNALARKVREGELAKVIIKGKDKFGGVMVEPLDGDGKSVCEWMVDKKFAKPWDGQGDKPE